MHVKVPLESVRVGAQLVVLLVETGAADERAQVERLIVLADDGGAREQRSRHTWLMLSGKTNEMKRYFL